MARSIISTVVIAWSVAVAVAQTTPPAVTMDKPVDYSNAGISIAVPKDFQLNAANAPFDVLSAKIEKSGRSVESVTLSAFPLTGQVSAEEFAESKMAELKRNILIRDLKTLRKTPMPVAGAKGAARLVSYTYRGRWPPKSISSATSRTAPTASVIC